MFYFMIGRSSCSSNFSLRLRSQAHDEVLTVCTETIHFNLIASPHEFELWRLDVKYIINTRLLYKKCNQRALFLKIKKETKLILRNNNNNNNNNDNNDNNNKTKQSGRLEAIITPRSPLAMFLNKCAIFPSSGFDTPKRFCYILKRNSKEQVAEESALL